MSLCYTPETNLRHCKSATLSLKIIWQSNVFWSGTSSKTAERCRAVWVAPSLLGTDV